MDTPTVATIIDFMTVEVKTAWAELERLIREARLRDGE